MDFKHIYLNSTEISYSIRNNSVSTICLEGFVPCGYAKEFSTTRMRSIDKQFRSSLKTATRNKHLKFADICDFDVYAGKLKYQLWFKFDKPIQLRKKSDTSEIISNKDLNAVIDNLNEISYI